MSKGLTNDVFARIEQMAKEAQGLREKLRVEVCEFERKVCDECESPFYAVKGFEKKCLVCFKGDRGYKLLGGDKQFFALQDELLDAYEVIDELETEVVKMKKRCKRLRKLADSYEDRIHVLQDREVVPQSFIEGLDDKMIKKMLVLCHPDTNNGSDRSKEVTEFLLRLKEDL